jgi:hypothetical protein
VAFGDALDEGVAGASRGTAGRRFRTTGSKTSFSKEGVGDGVGP